MRIGRWLGWGVMIGSALWSAGCAHPLESRHTGAFEQNVRATGDALLIPIGHDWLRLQVVGPSIFHVQYAQTLAPFNQTSVAVLPQRQQVHFNWRITGGNQLVVSTASLAARVDLRGGAVSFVDPRGRLLLAERSRQLSPATVQGAQTDHLHQTWNDSPGEHWFGLGQNQLGLTDLAGYDLDLWQHNGTIALPMLLSDRGYGILWDNPSFTRFGDLRPMVPIPAEDLAGGALTASYFSGDTAEGSPTVTRPEPAIAVDERPELNQRPNPDYHPTPLPAKEAAHGVACWEGTVIAPATGDYQFQSFFNGSFRLWLDGRLVTDHWRQNWLPWYDLARVRWAAGTRHALRAEWDRQQGDVAQLRWKPPLSAARPPLSLWSQVGEKIDYYFIYGGPSVTAPTGAATPADRVLAGYRQLTGPAPLMPQWAFGLWQSRQRYETAQQSLDVVKGYRARRIPFDNIVQDWQYWPRDAWGSQTFDPARFPDPAGWIKAIHDEHAHLMISVWAKFYAGIKNYDEMNRRGFLYPENQQEHLVDWLGYAYSFFDAFNPAARDLMWAMVKPHLFDNGVDAWWLDATEPDLLPTPTLQGQMSHVNPTALGPGTRVLNAYAPMMAKAFDEHQRHDAPDRRVFILTRSGYSGLQRYAAAVWSGDTTSTWTAMAKQIPAGIGLCMSGVPYWTMDIGGFSVPSRFSQKQPSAADVEEWRELNARWFEFGTFVPLLRVHGEYPYREMWEFGGEQSPAYAAMLRFDRIRYHLLPYVYSLAADVTYCGGTMMRGLAMDFPADQQATAIADQYLFGPALMISPITRFHARSRAVYLPRGTDWYDFWTGHRLAGGDTVQANAPFDQIPLHVRAGALLATGPDQQYVGEHPNPPITLWVYTGRDGIFTLYQDDGNSNAYERGESASIPLRWDDSSQTLTIGARQGSYPGMPVQRIFHVLFVTPGKPVGFSFNPAVDRTVQYDGHAVTLAP